MDNDNDTPITAPSPLPKNTADSTTTPSSNHPWLDDNISIHLHLARSWLQQKAIKKESDPKANPDREWAGLYSDDGSCLEVLSLETSATLQIIQTNPLTFSDGEATVRASLGQNTHLASSFAHGQFITLHKYTIRHTAYGPLRDRIIIVPEAISHSSVAHFGAQTTLKPITDCESVVSALQDLQDARIRLDRRCFLSSAEPANETMVPRHHHENDASQSSLNTQLPFGTQIPARSRPRLEDDEEVRHIGTRRMEPVLAGNTRREELHERTTDGEKRDEETREKLLKLWSTNQPAAPSKSPEAAERNRNQVASPAPRRASAQSNEETLRSRERPVQSTARKSTTAEPANPTPSGVEQLDESYIVQIPDGPNLTSSNEDELGDSDPSWLQLRPVASSAIVHPRQRSILDLPESWHKPGVGLKFPDANIPIEILEALKIKLRSSGEHTTSSIDAPPATIPEEQIDTSMEEIEGDIATTQESGQMSWPTSPAVKPPASSPAPRPPQNIARNNAGLPPDSSFEASTNVPIDEQSKNIPPSSPPELPAAQESDDEMELDVPRGLDDKSSVAGSQPTRPVETVQVKETPYIKDKKAPPAHRQQENIVDDPYKGASSHSVVYGTYNDAQPSADPFTEHTGAHNDANLVKTTADDVTMREAGVESSNEQSTTNSQNNLDVGGSLIDDEAKPVQVRDVDNDTSTTTSHAKRKLIHSPSRKSSREMKKRGIKFSSLGPPSPPRDIEARLREEKRHSLKNFRDQKKFEVAAAQLPQSTRMDTHFDTEAGAGSHDPSVPAVKREMSTSPSEPGSAARNSAQHSQQIQMVDRNATTPNTSFLNMQERLEDVDINMDLYEHPTPDKKRNDDRSRRSSPMDVDVTDNPAPRRVQDPHSSPTHEHNAQEQGPKPTTIFQHFKVVYPGYTGDHKHFSNLCKQMISLDKEDKMVPKWQWDDYVIRNKSHYSAYARQCVEDGEEPEPYHRFYKDHIRDTLHTKSVIKNRQTLVTALEELASLPNPSHSSFSSFNEASSNPPNFKESTPKEPPRNPTRNSLPALNRVSSSTVRTTSESPVSNELTPREPRPLSKQNRIPSENRPTSSSTRRKKRRTLPSTFAPHMSSTMEEPSASSPLPNRDPRAKQPTDRAPSSTSLNRPDPEGKQPVRASLPSSSTIPPKPNDDPPTTTSSAQPRNRQSRYSQRGSAFAPPSTTRNAFQLPPQQAQQQQQQQPATTAATPTGDPFRDYCRGLESVTSWTGSSEVRRRRSSPSRRR
ncbi:hypothetical protein DM02DRAFT_613057 [Periconia macrospinosa]|uniref:Telomere replication protein EST3 n=1 Tax=Periconia macrospinosa TaxID=97972 RepID=A0A2V1DW24_9PLEO|nr:hypothetical protein DM02DRAFT_613057 [Periconia macrospinosa]